MNKLSRLTLISVIFCCFTASYAQAQCGELGYEIITKAKCDSPGNRGTIKVIPPAECTITPGNVYELWTTDGLSIKVKESLPNGDIITDVPPGEFQIVGNPASDCTCWGGTGILSANVTMPYALSIDTAATTVVRCQGDAAVRVNATAKNGVGPYTFSLYADGNPTLLATLSSGTSVILTTSVIAPKYIIKIKDGGCISPDATAEYEVDLTDYNNIPTVITAGATKLCIGGTINLKADYPGATAIQWTWPNGVLSASDAVLIAPATAADSGTYTVSMKMPGCASSYTESIDVDVSKPVKPVVPDTAVYSCLTISPEPGGYDLAGTATPTSPADYDLVWYGPNSQTMLIGPTAPVVPTEAPVVVYYYVSQKDKTLGCESDQVRIKVEVKDRPAPINASRIDYCLDPSNPGSATIRITGAGNEREYYLYSVAAGVGAISASGVSHNDTAYINSPVTVGITYYVETKDEYGCISTTRTPITVPAIQPLITAADDLCLGDSLTFKTVDSYPAGKVRWTRPDNSLLVADSLTLNSSHLTAAGVYEVKVSVARWTGCTIRDSVKFTVHETPMPAVSPTSYDVCRNRPASPMSATALTQHTLRWYDPSGNLITESGGAPSQSPVPDVSVAGTFIYKVSQVKDDALSCESSKVDVTVLVREVTAPIPTNDIKTCINSIPEVKIAHSLVGTMYYLYEAEHDVTPIATETGNGGVMSFNHGEYVSSGIVYWYVSCKEFNKCESDKARIKIIAENEIINRDASNELICENSRGKLTATEIEMPGTTYQWTKPDGTVVPNTPELEVLGVPAEMGIYTLTIQTPDCRSISRDYRVSLGKPDKPTAPASVEYCRNDVAVPLTGTPSGGCTLVWYDAGGTELSEAPTPSTAVAGASSYYLKQRITGTDCESDQAAEIVVTINALPSPVSNIDPAAVCTGGSPTVEIAASVAGFKYRVYSDQTNGAPISGEVEGTVSGSIYLPTSTHVTANIIYYVETEDASGCIAQSRTPVEIEVTSLYIQPDRLPPYKRNVPYSQQLNSNASQPSYILQTGDLPPGFSLSTSGEIGGTVSTTGGLARETFTVRVEDNAGCIAEKEYTLEFITTVSEIFTPNGDGVNDVFMKGCRITVFDRLGRKIFAGNDGWDGTYNGSPVAGDTYFYVLHYVDDTEQMVKTNGSVTVLR